MLGNIAVILAHRNLQLHVTTMIRCFSYYTDA